MMMDTLACIAGAGAYYGVPDEIAMEVMQRLDEPLRDVLIQFIQKYPGA